MWSVLRRSFALYLTVMVLALVGRVSLTFLTVGGVAAASMATSEGDKSMAQVATDAWAGMETLARTLSRGQYGPERRGVIDMPQIVRAGAAVEHPPRRSSGPLILTVAD
jgi:hypothetical protein